MSLKAPCSDVRAIYNDARKNGIVGPIDKGWIVFTGKGSRREVQLFVEAFRGIGLTESQGRFRWPEECGDPTK